MPIFQQNLGEPHIDKVYDQTCELTFQVISDNIDLYFFVHCIDLFFASFVMRDTLVLHIWSVVGEIFELSAQHKMVHLRECWFDHLILDILVSNSLGIFLGMKALKLLKFEVYDWLGRSGAKSWREWKIFSGPRRMQGLAYTFLVITINFYGGFFFTDVLWVHPTDSIAWIRMTIQILLAMLAFNECYRDISTWGTKQRQYNPIEGRYRWLAFSNAMMQLLITIKFHDGAPNYLSTPTPMYIIVPWVIAIASGIVIILYNRFIKGYKSKQLINDCNKQIKDVEGKNN